MSPLGPPRLWPSPMREGRHGLLAPPREAMVVCGHGNEKWEERLQKKPPGELGYPWLLPLSFFVTLPAINHVNAISS